MARLQHWAELDSHNLFCKGSGLAPEGWERRQDSWSSGCLVPVITNDVSVRFGIEL